MLWGGSEEHAHFIIPLEWFVLTEEELVPAMDRWIHEFREAQKHKEEEERKKREEAEKKEELAELARLQAKYSDSASMN